MSNLPRDLAIEILCRQTVKSLLRFRCVSKEWCSLIDSPDFIKLHLSHTIETATNLTLILAGFDNLKILSVDLPALDNAVELHHDHPFKPDKTYKVVGSYNGLLALYNCEEGFSLWNPSTKTHQILPKFWKDFKGNFCFCDGFGYDDVTDDYKIVRVMQVHMTNHTVVIVYSLKGNSRRVINFIGFPYYFHFPHTQGFGVLAGGSLHWKVNRRVGKSDTEQLIMAFDLADEEFREVELPDTSVRHSLITMGVLGGCFCISCYYRDHVDVWVIKKDRMIDSWTKLLTVSESKGCYLKALAYSKSGDKVLIRGQCKNDNIYCWYDLEKKRFDDKAFRFDDEPKCVYETVICVGSLVNEGNLMVSELTEAELVVPHCVVNYRPKRTKNVGQNKSMQYL